MTVTLMTREWFRAPSADFVTELEGVGGGWTVRQNGVNVGYFAYGGANQYMVTVNNTDIVAMGSWDYMVAWVSETDLTLSATDLLSVR